MLHARILRYLDEVVRAGSIRKAAARLGLAASSISRQIADLEEEIGTPVFERMPGGLRLTAAGEMLMNHVRQTLKEHDRLISRIGNLQNPGAGTVRIATQNGLIGGLVPRLVLDFSERFPEVRFAISSLTGQALVAAVKSGEADIGFGYNLPADARVKTLLSFVARLGAVVHPTHRLARRNGVRLAECAAYPMVIADASMSLRKVIEDAALRSRARIDSVIDTNSIELMKQVLEDGETVSILSEPDVIGEVRAGRFCYIPLLDRGMDTQILSLVQREHAVIELSAALLLEEMTRLLAGMQEAL